MTRLLASVTSAAEAYIALAGGADIIDLKDPARGALGALAPQQIADTVQAVAGRRRVSATVGDPPYAPQALLKRITGTAAAGVDYVKIGIPPQLSAADWRALADAVRIAHPARLVAVLFADRDPDLSLIERLAGLRFGGVMLDTAAKQSGRLRDHVDDAVLRHFAERAHAVGLIAGLAGSLRCVDIPHLLPLGADYLGFRGALCAGSRREAELDAMRIADVRRAIATRGAAAVAPVEESSIADSRP